jgi:hypothetical protein
VRLPGGLTVYLDVSHVGPSGDLVTPAAPIAPQFGPPTVFSAPLPSGSGARALGLAGAFTAVADDATAASWNPGGLTQLERPEASVVVRHSSEQNRHRSEDDDFRVGDNRFDSTGVNYFSLAQPFQLLRRNWVFSLNYQEAYDFSQRFDADQRQAASRTQTDQRTEAYSRTKTERIVDGIVELDVTSRLTTRKVTTLSQVLGSDMLTGLNFNQEGVVSAISPALAIEATPRCSFGTAVNLYRDFTPEGRPIRSATVARYTGSSRNQADAITTQTTSGDYTYQGVIRWSQLLPFLQDQAVGPTDGSIAPFTDRSASSSDQAVVFDGVYREENAYRNFQGVNATLGGLFTLSRHLSLGLTVDLPWKAEARQSRHLRNIVTTYNADRSQVLDVTETRENQSRDVEFTFPLYAAVGAVWRWTDRLYTTWDVSRTQWSDFSYKAEGEPRVNPLDGTRHGLHDLDDCWSTRMGLEYLCVLRRTEIPLRAGLSWEQRPAIGSPDEYWGLSLGSGISIGQDPGKVILDFAYRYTAGNDVMGSLIPGQSDLTTDVRRQDFFLSGIWHF